MHLFSSVKRKFVLIASLILLSKISSHHLVNFVGAVRLPQQLSGCEGDNSRDKLIFKDIKRDTQEERIITGDDDHRATVNIVAIVFGNINFVACSFVIYTAFIKWRAGSLSMSNRVPLYLSFSDVFQYLVFMPNFIYSMVHDATIPGVTCKVLAFLLFLQTNINTVLMTSVSVITYLRVAKGKNLNLGPYDWKFFVVIIFLSSIISTPSIISLGPSRFWCLTNTKPANYLLIDDYALFITTLMITCFCYFKTLSIILNVDREDMTNSAERIDRWNRLERQAVRKISIYIALFILKWVPLVAFGIGVMLGYDRLWVHLVFIVSFNMGGVSYCGLYLMNEFIIKHNTTTTPQQTNAFAALHSTKVNVPQPEVCQVTLPVEALVPFSDSIADCVILNSGPYSPYGNSRQSDNCSTICDNESSRRGKYTEKDTLCGGGKMKVIDALEIL